MYDYAKAASSQNVYEEPTSIKPAPGVGEKTGEQSLAKAEVDVSNEADRREPTHIYSKGTCTSKTSFSIFYQLYTNDFLFAKEDV